jgi:hypothetical protein
MYVTTAYLYQQTQKVLMIDTSGNYFDARWRPVYAKNLKLNLGVDNVILFQFQNQDQRPVNITGSTFTFRIISQNGKNLLYSRDLTVLNAGTGRSKVTIPAEDTRHFLSQPASWSIEVASGDLSQAVFTDDYAGARGDIDIVDSVLPAFVASAVLTIPAQAPTDSVYYSSVVETDGRSLTTFQLDFDNFTGNLQVEGTTSGMSETTEWYTVDFEDLESDTEVASLSFSNSNDRRAINVAGFHPNLRLSLETNSGNVSLIQYR